jgi:hypothetical protein
MLRFRRDGTIRVPSPAALRNPHGPTQGRLTARALVLTDRTRKRGGRKSRRTHARVWDTP